MSWWIYFEQMVIFSVSVSVSKLNLDAGGNGEECLRRPGRVSASGRASGWPHPPHWKRSLPVTWKRPQEGAISHRWVTQKTLAPIMLATSETLRKPY